MSPVAAARRYPRELAPLETKPLRGVRDSTNPVDADLGLAQAANNMMRGTFEGLKARPASSTANLGFPAGLVRALGAAFEHVYTDVNGVVQSLTLLFGFNGSTWKMWRANWDATWTDLTPAGVAIDTATTTRVYCENFANKLIVTDGVNPPWAYDAGAGTAAYINLVSAGTALQKRAFGRPTVYYAKLFFVKADDRRTAVWSEEADPTLGYEQTSYDNAWTLAQSGAADLYALFGTNAALYFFRAESCGAILGAASSDFRAAGTTDDVSGEVGCTSPASIFAIGGAVHFVDKTGRPFVIDPGAGLVPLWGDCTVTVSASLAGGANKTIAAGGTNEAWGAYYPNIDTFVWTIANPGGSGPAQLIAFHGASRQHVGTWSESGTAPYKFGSIVRRKDAANGDRPTLMILNSVGVPSYHFDLIDYAAASSAQATSPPLGFHPRNDRNFHTLHVYGPTPYGNIYYLTSRTSSAQGPLTPVFAVTATRYSVGASAFGRWVQVTCQAAHISGFAAEAFDLGPQPGIP